MVENRREISGEPDVLSADRHSRAEKFPTAEIRKHDLSSLEVLYLAGEPLDEPTASWVSNTLDVPVIDNYWQTESGWPIMAIARGLDDRPTRLGSPGVPMYGYNVQLLNEVTGEPCGVNEKGMLVVEGRCRRGVFRPSGATTTAL